MIDTACMSHSVATSIPLPAEKEHDPRLLNGDLPLSSAQRRAYMKFHRARNTRNREASVRQQIRTFPQPRFAHGFSDLSSPSRAALDRFVLWASHAFKAHWQSRDIRVLDIGCGSGYAAQLLEQAGLRGVYVGLDHAAHPKFDAMTSAQFARRLIVADVHHTDLVSLGPFDLIVSMTSLEHFEDDRAALEAIRRAAAPGAAELHIVPAEDGLNLWEAHGWRQYSPACVAALCPDAQIYRIGGWASSLLHRMMITRPSRRGRDGRTRFPALYRAARSLALRIDQWTGNSPASLYAAVRWPGDGA